MAPHPPPAPRRGAASLGARERWFAALAWQAWRGGRPIGRADLHRITGVQPTPTGQSVAALIGAGLLRESPPTPPPAGHATDRGRPVLRLEPDPDRRCVIGLSLAPGEIRIGRLDLRGQPVGRERLRRVTRPTTIVGVAAGLLAATVGRSTPRSPLAIGLSVTGLVDREGHASLFSSASPDPTAAVSLEPLFRAAAGLPLSLDNDVHALAARWRLDRPDVPSSDRRGAADAAGEVVLLVSLDDGRLGASLLIGGRSQDGCVTSANELGHTRLAIPTDPCYCGQTGCLERIFSTPHLHRLGAPARRSLAQALAGPLVEDAALETLLGHLALGLANAVNFARPARLVLAGPSVTLPRLVHFLQAKLPPLLLPGLRPRVRVEFWEQPSVQSAANAAWLALSDLLGSLDPNTPFPPRRAG